MLERREMRRFSPPHAVDSERMISLPACVSSAPHRNTWDLSVPGSLCCGMPLTRRNSLSRLNSRSTLRKDRIGGVEVLEAESVRSRIVFEFGDPVFRVGAMIVVPPDLFRRCRQTGHQQAKGVLGQIDQLLSHRWLG